MQDSRKAVRLNVTIDRAVYERLDREVPPNDVNRFINDAIRARLRPSREALDAAYGAAAREPWRRKAAGEWDATDVDSWPEWTLHLPSAQRSRR